MQNNPDVSPDNWWYIMPETGQHIALYSVKSLEILTQKMGLNFFTNGKNFHPFTKKKINSFIFRLMMSYKIAWVVDLLLSNPPSRLQKDYNSIKG